jgi:hypothetical protein
LPWYQSIPYRVDRRVQLPAVPLERKLQLLTAVVEVADRTVFEPNRKVSVTPLP